MDVKNYILLKRYIDSLIGEGGSGSGQPGKSAYEIACDNGFVGTEEEWLKSLSPSIGPGGTWIIGGIDTGVIASPDLANYATVEFVEQTEVHLEQQISQMADAYEVIEF